MGYSCITAKNDPSHLGFEGRGCQVGHFLQSYKNEDTLCALYQDKLQNIIPLHNKCLKLDYI